MNKPKSLRIAGVMNTVWPGTGQLYLGQYRFGIILAAAFGLCFLIAAGLFVRAMTIYFQVATDGRIMEDGQLEKLGDAIHKNWLIGLMIGGVVLWVISLATLKSDVAAESSPVPPPVVPPPIPPPPK